MKDLFSTQKQRDSAVAAFTNLINSEGWMLLKKIVDANSKVLGEKILGGNDNETIEDVRVSREKFKAYNEIINTPDMMIKRLRKQDQVEEEDDPYPTA